MRPRLVACKFAAALRDARVPLVPVITLPASDLLRDVIEMEIDCTIDAFNDDGDWESGGITSYVYSLRSIPFIHMSYERDRWAKQVEDNGPDWRPRMAHEGYLTPGEQLAKIVVPDEATMDFDQAASVFDALTSAVEMVKEADEGDEPIWDGAQLEEWRQAIAAQLRIDLPTT